jgi:hypothetical protein
MMCGVKGRFTEGWVCKNEQMFSMWKMSSMSNINKPGHVQLMSGFPKPEQFKWRTSWGEAAIEGLKES